MKGDVQELEKTLSSHVSSSNLCTSDEILLQTLQVKLKTKGKELQVLDQQIICGNIPRLRRDLYKEKLRENKIWLTSYGEGCPDIDLLIGADYCGNIFTGRICILKSNLIACETYLGWVIMGNMSEERFDETSSHLVTSLLIKNSSVADLWKLDIIGHFRKTVQRDENGRYIVKLPWLETYETLSENKDIAEKRCITTTQKRLKEGKYNDYEAVFKEWLQETIIEEVPDSELGNLCHYLPHRGIFKGNSTTKVRPVFDASCRSKNTLSLNDYLETGPNLIEKIPPLLMRFRQKEIGVVSDIKKAFLQISVAKEDQDFLRFIWWEDYKERKQKIYRHRRVVFGLTSSPFLLAAVPDYHLETK
ncbi:uncharacterized protein LOC118191201 [Stegodyphus dumicola]|uniref:uncharacterized protein LOC118191201 n=1 Tax=Stegodyphus dumicola TaxID=202533 RepID=UPI0015ACF63C|nr:uncharacterized protein LOC118191201 [Stegodyphus dumicola]